MVIVTKSSEKTRQIGYISSTFLLYPPPPNVLRSPPRFLIVILLASAGIYYCACVCAVFEAGECTR